MGSITGKPVKCMGIKMKIKIIGSGGCVSTPRPCCNCKVCREAREKGFPYARTGCSLFIEEENILIDTPEDINDSLNHANVSDVNYILYSHVDPDHTMGMRVIEQLRMDWLNVSVGMKNQNPVYVAALPAILKDLKMQGTKYGSALEYYEKCGLVTLNPISHLEAGGIVIDFVPTDDSQSVTIFVISESEGTGECRKVIYAPCDVKPFPDSKIFYNADTLIIGNTIVGDVLKNGFVLEPDNPLREELFVMNEIAAIKEKYKIKNVVVTHLEEDWGKSYDDYMELEKQYDGIKFAYDGMEII